MSWQLITDEWRLKLLALGLAVLMFGAVAFSQTNTRTLQVNIYYNNLPSGLVLLSPIDKINVVVSGPGDLVPTVTASSLIATADLSHVKKGTALSVPIQVRSTDLRIVVQSPPPIAVNVDNQTSIQLDVQVQTPNVATGWSPILSVATCGTSGETCKVTFVGPSSVATGLQAFVSVGDQINAEKTDVLNQSIQFEQNGHPIDMTKLTTLPEIIVNPLTVTAHVEAKRGTAATQVVLVDDAPTRRPPAGYRITNITVEPISVQCTGPADVIASLATITLPGVDLGSSTSNASFRVPIQPPTGVSCSSATAKVTYTIAQNPNTSPSPQ